MKCLLCKDIDLLPVANTTMNNFEIHVYCPKCKRIYVEDLTRGVLKGIENNDNELYFDIGLHYDEVMINDSSFKNCINNFIEEFTRNNIKEREEIFDIKPSPISYYNDLTEYVIDTINENDIIREELDSIGGTVTQLIEEYEELYEEYDL